MAGMSLMIGTLAGTFGGILISSNLTGYRIEQLEKRWPNTTKSSSAPINWRGRMLEAGA